MTGITDLPPETVEEILLNCDPLEVSKFAQTSRWSRTLVYHTEDNHLWRALYLQQPFDDPRICVSHNAQPRTDIDWRSELQRIIHARTILQDPTSCQPDDLLPVLSTLCDLVCNVRPLSSPLNRDELSQNLLWVAATLRGGRLFDQIVIHPSLPEEQQLSARLHTYFGLTRADASRARRVQSRAYVYSMRNYRFDNSFGPFLMDGSGRVNWVHIEAIHHVVSMHLVDLREDEDFEFTIFPMSLPFTQIVIPEGVDLDQEVDWAGVAGLWRCSFCFCDHRDLLRYNDLNRSENEPLDTAMFEDEDFREAFRTLEVQLHITHTTEDPNFPTRRRIYYVGEMSGTSTMTGSVQMTPDEHVQWHFVSGEHGNAIWSSEGVQVGGIRSAFGVLGSWTTIFHDEDDPIGPFWLRKASTSLETANT